MAAPRGHVGATRYGAGAWGYRARRAHASAQRCAVPRPKARPQAEGAPDGEYVYDASRMSEPAPLVLLMEDDHDLRETISELMEAQGVEVRAACDGCEGLEILRAGLRPRAVFLDQCMPRLDGASVLAAMVEDPALADIPVVWMTGERRKPPTPVAVCLQKPFDLGDLTAVLTSLCSP